MSFSFSLTFFQKAGKFQFQLSIITVYVKAQVKIKSKFKPPTPDSTNLFPNIRMHFHFFITYTASDEKIKMHL